MDFAFGVINVYKILLIKTFLGQDEMSFGQGVKENFFAPCDEIWVEMALKSSVNYKYESETTLHQKYHDEIVAVKTAVWIITQ